MSGHDDGGEARLREAAERCCNWGRWGDDDEIGTLNFVTPEMIVEASRLVLRGAVFSLAIDFGDSGPQQGFLGRFNPMTFMLRDGDDVYARSLAGAPQGIGGADDVFFLPTQGATQWDALAHIFYDSRMWNGYDCRLVSSLGAERNDIANYPRSDRRPCRPAGRAAPPRRRVVRARPGHRSGDARRGGGGPGGRGAPRRLRPPAVRTDRPVPGGRRLGLVRRRRRPRPGLRHPRLDPRARDRRAGERHVGCRGAAERADLREPALAPRRAPADGLCVGELFDLERLAADCADDRVYEMFFCANPLPVTGSVGGPINPTAIK